MTMKVVFEFTYKGVQSLKVATTVDTMDQGKLVQQIVGVGKPFIAFNYLPAAPIAADFTGLPVVSSDIAINNQTIADMLADPAAMMERLTFAS